MSEPLFDVMSRQKAMIKAPDGNSYDEPWWSEPIVPGALPHSNIAGEFIGQITEGPGGNQSCGLTGQLNALILRQTIDPGTAAAVQEELAVSQAYARFWRQANEANYLGWQGHPSVLAFFLSREFDAPTAFRYVQTPDTTELETDLQDGFAALMVGRSVYGTHSRLGFETEDSEGRLFVHDPKYPQSTGFYNYDSLPDLQQGNHAIIY